MKKRSRQKNVAVAEDSSIADLFSCKLGDDVDHFSLPISWTAVDTNKVYRKLENNLYKMFPRRQVDKDESTAPCQCVDSCDSQCQNRQLFMYVLLGCKHTSSIFLINMLYLGNVIQPCVLR